MHQRLAAHRRAGVRIVILSNSLQPVLSAAAARLGVEGIGSTLGSNGQVAPVGLCGT
jgi:phosphoserine phosphatase